MGEAPGPARSGASLTAKGGFAPKGRASTGARANRKAWAATGGRERADRAKLLEPIGNR